MEPKKLRGSRTTTVFDEKGAAGTKHTASHTMIFNECITKGDGDKTSIGFESLASPLFTAEDDGEVFFQIMLEMSAAKSDESEFKVSINLKSKPLGLTVHFHSELQKNSEGSFRKKDVYTPCEVTVPSDVETISASFPDSFVLKAKGGVLKLRLDTTYFKVNSQLNGEPTPIMRSRPAPSLGTELLKYSPFSDVTFKAAADGREWNLHKCVLVTRSKVFAAMFSSDMKENKDGVVEFKDIDSTALDLLIKFIYTDCIDLHVIQQGTAMELLDLAEQYDLPILKKLCERRLISHLSAENCLHLCAFAGKHNCQLLLTPAKRMLADNLANICKSQKDELADFVREYGDLSIAVFESLKMG